MSIRRVGGDEHKDGKDQKPADGRAFTLTISLLGTGYHVRNPDCQCALTELVKTIETGPTQAVYLINGPGAKAKPDAQNRKEYKSFVPDEKTDTFTLGEYKPAIKFNPETGDISVKKTQRPYFERPSTLGGMLLGTGTDEARDEILALAKAIIDSGKVPAVFNIVGFSRGADTAIRAANDLQAMYGSDIIKVNICAVDPVPGPLREAQEARVIPRCVDDYVGIYMLGENRFGFEPTSDVLFEDPTHTKASLQIYGGKHGDGHRENYPLYDPRNYSAELGRMQIESFLRRNGSNIKYTIPVVRLNKEINLLEIQKDLLPLDEETIQAIESTYDIKRFEMYTRLAALRGDDSVAGWFSSGRSFASRKFEFILHGHDYFINKEHQELFKKFFPRYFDYFFQCAVEKTTFQQVQEEMKANCEGFWKGAFPKNLSKSFALMKSGYWAPDEKDTEKNSKPKGIKLIAQSTTDRPESKGEHKTVVHDELSQLMYSILASGRYAPLLGAPAKVADDLCTEVQTIVRRKHYSDHSAATKDFLTFIRAPISVSSDEIEEFYSSTVAQCRFAVFNAYLKLKEAGYKGPYYFQLQEIINRSPATKLLFSFMETHPKFPEDVQHFLSSTAVYMEEVFAHPEFDDAEKIKVLNQQLTKNLNIFLNNHKSATGELLDTINALKKHVESQFIASTAVYYPDWRDLSKAASGANIYASRVKSIHE